MNEVRVIWAVDGTEHEHGLFESVARTFSSLSSVSWVIQPVYVALPDRLDVSTQFSPSTLNVGVSKAQVRLKDHLSHFKISGLREPRTVVDLTGNLGAAAAQLKGAAKDFSADFVACGSHGYSGVDRLVSNSFSEFLVLTQEFPMMVVTPRTLVAEYDSRVIFPYQRLEELDELDSAREFMTDKLGFDIQGLRVNGAPAPVANWGGVPTQTIATDPVTGVPGSICEYAAQKRAHIAMSSHSSLVNPRLSESVTRQVLEHSTTPLWVFPRTREASGAPSGTAAAE